MCDVNYATLFDMDGVILLNKTIHAKVSSKSIDFLMKKLPKYSGKTINRKAARYINKLAYKNLGHTALIFGNERDNIHDYNEFVFDREMMTFVYHSIDQRDRNLYRNIADRIKDANIDTIGLFTNTPYCYCEAVINSLEFEEFTTIGDSLLSLAFTSDIGLVKPMPQYYDTVQDAFPHVSEIHFLDDSSKNFNPIHDNERWFNVLIEDQADIIQYLQYEIDYQRKSPQTNRILFKRIK